MTKKDLTTMILTIDVSSRAKRRRAVIIAIDLLERIRAAEGANIGRFPQNLQDGEAYENAECSHEIIADAIIGLGDAY